MTRRWRAQLQRLLLPAATLTAFAVLGCGASAPVTTYTPDREAKLVTVNVDVSDEGFSPASIRIPAGRNIQLILRSRSNAEHHYRIIGLAPAEMLWLAQPEEMVREEGVTEEDHEQHHAKDFVTFRGTSPAGVKPTLTEVHAYVIGRSVDVVHFYALTPGTYEVDDPLHPELRGRVTVYAP